MSEMVILTGSPEDARVRALADATGLPLQRGNTPSGEVSLYLQYRDDRLVLADARAPRQNPVAVDFAALARRRRGGEMLVRAVGGRRAARVLDATAGLGRDAFVLAAQGAEVTLLERHPVIAALLADGLRRGLSEDEVMDTCARMTLRSESAEAVLSALSPEHSPDVVYLDPMFTASGKSALAKKEMQLLQGLLGHGEVADELLEPALARAYHRVVVKRALKAAPLDGREPSFSLKGRAVRFDVYAKRKF